MILVMMVSAEFECQSFPALTTTRPRPFVDGGSFVLVGGKQAWTGETTPVVSPIGGEIGRLSVMGPNEALQALDAAVEAAEPWARLTYKERAERISKFLNALPRSEIIELLTWEIAKNTKDATSEFDRTLTFARQLLPTDETKTVQGVTGTVRRGPVGVCLMLAPFNYPLNEMYAMMIPALLMGNVVVLKLPNFGGLVHILTVEALEQLPPGVVNFVTGSGRITLPPVMKSGKVDMLGFIGGSRGADALIAAHPHPHRLKVFSQLEGKNMGIVLQDADLPSAVEDIVKGALSYNGQRCTAIKLVLVHESIAEEFVAKLKAAIETLKVGLPWDSSDITPLPEPSKPLYLQDLIADALKKGAHLLTGGELRGQLFSPALLTGITPDMRVFHEEQFGPLVPVATFRDIDDVIQHARASWNGQQAALFTQADAQSAARLVDALAPILGRININMPCSRGPDVFPFSGRRSSAMGTMSVTHAIQAFSVETLVATRPDDQLLVEAIHQRSSFLAPLE